jgi:hypothetical protein
MGFTTFILLTGFDLGKRDDFDPELLAYIFSKSSFLWWFEAVVIKGFFYLLGMGSTPFFELLCYTGYKFIPLCLIISANILGGEMFFWGAEVLFSAMFALFTYKTFRRFSGVNTLAD